MLQDQLLYPHRGNYEELLVLLVFFVCFAVTIALLLLGGWHIYLVTVAETSIEVQINRKIHKDNRVSKQCIVCVCMCVRTRVLCMFVCNVSMCVVMSIVYKFLLPLFEQPFLLHVK